MGSNSKIEWCDHTFNPWMGCTKVSQGCANCYAEQLMDKRWNKVQWGRQGKRVKTSVANWWEPVRWNKQAEELGIRYRVFCASLADVFEYKDDQPELDVWRAELFALMLETPNLDWMVLTKRPENVRSMLRAAGEWWYQAAPTTYDVKLLRWVHHGEHFAPENVWIGTSVENQEQADSRIPALLNIPAKVRFLSMEPLLRSVDLGLTMLDYPSYTEEDPGEPLSYPSKAGQLINWVIVGGESGPHARPMHPDWVRSVRDQCVEAGVKFFFKQWGEWAPCTHFAIDEGTERNKVHRFEDGLLMYRYGKKVAGRELDGQEWNEMPS